MATYTRNVNYQYSSAAVRMREIEHPNYKKQTYSNHRIKAGSIGYVLFIAVALIATAFVLVGYISLRADVTNRLEHISRLETQLNELKLENDATYSRINSNMDLEEIREAAINELGMTYAKEGQVETFTSENGDYVRQLAKIPD